MLASVLHTRNLVSFFITLLSCILSLSYSNEHGCKEVPFKRAKLVRTIPANAQLLRLTFSPSASKVVDLTVEESVSKIIVRTHPPLTQGTDFDLYSFAKENSIPENYKKSRKRQYLGLKLRAGKLWTTSSSQDSLFVSAVYFCPISTAHTRTIDALPGSSHVLVANISHALKPCPQLPSSLMSSLSGGLLQHVKQVISECMNPTVWKTQLLDWKRISSLRLLTMQPGLVILDGTAQSLSDAADAVDKFVAAHSVLEVSWEPYSDADPRWWLLVPRPQGMPGHLFALLDMLQWEHPILANAEQYRNGPQCQSDSLDCVPGCPKTKIATVSGSGWGAAAEMLNRNFLVSLLEWEPMQVGPLRLGIRANPPLWTAQIGWGYTYNGCPSNFLDCYYLDHSPCPMIRVPFNSDYGSPFPDPNLRLANHRNETRYHNKPPWFQKVMGAEDSSIPSMSFGDLTSVSSDQVFYSYPLRPKFSIRQEVHRRVTAFNMTGHCAAVHVRRGDSIMDGSPRAYMHVSTYMRRSKALMNAFGLKTVFLVTDSQAAINEAQECAKEHPDVCAGITFRFIDKKRWIAAEGGWDNPYPSGDPRIEHMDMQFEFTLAQQCSISVIGDSGYGKKINAYMGCGFPMPLRGRMPKRCATPPHIQMRQAGFDCAKGNTMACDEKSNKGGDITKPLNDPANMLGANFSMLSAAFLSTGNVCLHAHRYSMCSEDESVVQQHTSSFLDAARYQLCGNFVDVGRDKPEFCV